GGDRTEPPVAGVLLGSVSPAAEALLHGLAAHAELGAEGGPAMAAGPRRAHRLLQEIPGGALGGGGARHDRQVVRGRGGVQRAPLALAIAHDRPAELLREEVAVARVRVARSRPHHFSSASSRLGSQRPPSSAVSSPSWACRIE